MKDNTKNKPNNKIILALPAVLVLLLGAYFLITNINSGSSESLTSTVTKVEYKNGLYEESISYQVPKSTNTLKATITIKDDVITEVSTSHVFSSPKSKEYTDPFDKEISGAVVGKKFKDLDIKILGGASLTSDAFNKIIDALTQKAKQ